MYYHECLLGRDWQREIPCLSRAITDLNIAVDMMSQGVKQMFRNYKQKTSPITPISESKEVTVSLSESESAQNDGGNNLVKNRNEITKNRAQTSVGVIQSKPNISTPVTVGYKPSSILTDQHNKKQRNPLRKRKKSTIFATKSDSDEGKREREKCADSSRKSQDLLEMKVARPIRRDGHRSKTILAKDPDKSFLQTSFLN